METVIFFDLGCNQSRAAPKEPSPDHRFGRDEYLARGIANSTQEYLGETRVRGGNPPPDTVGENMQTPRRKAPTSCRAAVKQERERALLFEIYCQ